MNAACRRCFPHFAHFPHPILIFVDANIFIQSALTDDRACNSAVALQCALVFRFFLDIAVRGIYSYHSSSYLSAAILDSLSLAVRNVSVVDASRCQSQIFNLTDRENAFE